jgi:hypothetical protein
MATRILMLVFVLLAAPVWAENAWQWDYDTTKGEIPPQATVERGPSSLGPFTPVATVPSLPSTYSMTWPADSLWYRITNSGGSSNVVQFTPLGGAYDDTALKAAIAALEARLKAAEAKNTAQDSDLLGIAAKNATQDAADITLDSRLDALEATPPVNSTVVVKTLNDKQIEVSCSSGARPSQVLDPTGLKRVISCP